MKTNDIKVLSLVAVLFIFGCSGGGGNGGFTSDEGGSVTNNDSSGDGTISDTNIPSSEDGGASPSEESECSMDSDCKDSKICGTDKKCIENSTTTKAKIQLTISGCPKGTTLLNSIVIKAVTDVKSDLFCKTNSGDFSRCAMVNDDIYIANTIPGALNITVYAVDPSGNKSNEAVCSYVYSAPPVLHSDGCPTGLVKDRSGTISFSSPDAVRFYCVMDNGAGESCTSPYAYTGLADGMHSFSFNGINALGQSSRELTCSWGVDGTLPTIVSLMPRPDSKVPVDMKIITIDFSEPMNKEDGTISTSPSLRGFGQFSTDGKSYNYFLSGPMSAEQKYILNVKDFKDVAGNVIQEYSSSFTAEAVSDSSPPTAPSNLVVTAPGGMSLDISWTASTDNVSSQDDIYYKILRSNENGVMGYLGSSCRGCTSYHDGPLYKKVYNYQVQACDMSGNCSSYASASGAPKPIAGDVNGDGYADIVVGAPQLGTIAMWAYGKAYLYLGGEVLPNNAKEYAMVVSGQVASDRVGQNVAMIGDVNNDGYEDLSISSGNFTTNNFPVYIFFGGSGISNYNDEAKKSKKTTDADVIITSPRDEMLGYGTVAALGDVSGDGIDDVGLSAKGKAYVLFGRKTWTKNIDISTEPESRASIVPYTFTSIASAGDFDGDGQREFAVGNPGDGVVRVFKVAGSSTKHMVQPIAEFTYSENSLTGDFGWSIVSTGPGKLLVGAPKMVVNGFAYAGKVLLCQIKDGKPECSTVFSGVKTKEFLGYSLAQGGYLYQDDKSELGTLIGSDNYADQARVIYRQGSKVIDVMIDPTNPGMFGYSVAISGDMTKFNPGRTSNLIIGHPGGVRGSEDGTFGGSLGGAVYIVPSNYNGDISTIKALYAESEFNTGYFGWSIGVRIEQ